MYNEPVNSEAVCEMPVEPIQVKIADINSVLNEVETMTTQLNATMYGSEQLPEEKKEKQIDSLSAALNDIRERLYNLARLVNKMKTKMEG